MKRLTSDTLGRTALAIVLCATVAVLAAGSAPVAAANGGGDVPLRTISVSGSGEAKGVPDEAHLSAGVVTQGRSAADALAANARAMNAVFASLKRMGIADKNIQTSNFNVMPQYENGNGSHEPRIAGYQVTNTVEVTVEGADKVGPAIDALVASGANQSYGISFSIHDPKPLEAAARRDAVQDAMAKARTIAEAAGVHLGPVLSISEGVYQRPPIPMMHARAMVADVAEPTPVAAGEASVDVNVSVVYEIE